MRSKAVSLCIALLAFALAGAALWAQNPCNPCSKKARNPCNPTAKMAAADGPAVNPCHAKMGTVFYIGDPMGRDSVTFTSHAPLEDIVGTSNQIKGYVVFDPAQPKKGGRGEFSIPAASLNTGIPLRNEHLSSQMWLDAAHFPHIGFTITEVKDVVAIAGQHGQGFKATLIGKLTLNGHTRTLRIRDARFVYLPESDKTKAKAPGDLLAGRATLGVDLKEFGVKGMDGVIGSKVSPHIGINISFVASTEQRSAGNPCNPCSKKKRSE